MKYYSTNHQAPVADLRKAVVKGLAEDRGLYMPETIHPLPKAFFDDMPTMKFQDIAYNVAANFFGDDIDGDCLQDLVYDTLSFDCPVVKVKDNIYALELFHGPTLAFKDVGARFMARLLQYFLRNGSVRNDANTTGGEVNVLVATSGDTGSAVANGFSVLRASTSTCSTPRARSVPFRNVNSPPSARTSLPSKLTVCSTTARH